MGYRSDVAYVIRFNTADERDTFVELVKHRNETLWTEAVDACETKYEQPIITFKAEDVKWYADYDDVKVHNEMLRWALELYEGAGYRIVTLGEDGVEEVYQDGVTDDLWDYIYTSHSLNTEFPALKSTTQE
jgi:hypothetical protein